MGRPELGTKCACASCAERFYDLNRSPAICPKCGASQPPVSVNASRRVRTYPGPGSAHMSRRPAAVIAEDEAEPIAAVEDDEDEDADDADDIPEIDADADDDAGPVIVRD